MYTLIAHFIADEFERVMVYKANGSIFAGCRIVNGYEKRYTWTKIPGKYTRAQDIMRVVGLFAMDLKISPYDLTGEEY